MALFKTPEQLAAGIALTKNSAKEFAQEAGISSMTLSRVLNSADLLNNMQTGTRERLESCFSLYDVEFIPGGARIAPQTTIVLSGIEGFAEFRQRVLKEVRSGNANVCVYNLDERDFDKWGKGEVNRVYRAEMAEIRATDPSLKFRSLIREGDKHVSAALHSEYKWADTEQFAGIPYYIFGRNAASIIFMENSCDIIIIRIPKYVNEKRKIFDKLWEQAQILDFNPIEVLKK